MFDIAFTPSARQALRDFRKYDQRKILDGIDNQLIHQPREETANRIHLRPNELAEFELRVGNFRVFYDVLDEESLVKVSAIGYKEGNKLFIHGKEYKL